MASIVTRENGSDASGGVAGVWANANGGIVGLVADDRTGPYVCFYAKGHSGFPALALFVDRDGNPRLQLPGPGGKASGCRQIKIADLVDAAGLSDGEPFEAAAPPAE